MCVWTTASRKMPTEHVVMLPCSFCLVSPVQRPHAQLPQAWRCWCCRDTFSWWLNVAEPLPAVSAGSWAAPGEPCTSQPCCGLWVWGGSGTTGRGDKAVLSVPASSQDPATPVCASPAAPSHGHLPRAASSSGGERGMCCLQIPGLFGEGCGWMHLEAPAHCPERCWCVWSLLWNCAGMWLSKERV